MLYITYWELNENMSLADQYHVAEKLMASGLVPSKGVNILRWDLTPDGWGVLIAEAESAADIERSLNLWRASAAGFFRLTKTAPAVTIQERMAATAELLKALDAK